MKKQILFVDDEQRVLQSLRRVLQAQAHLWEMTFVDHAEAAWNCLCEGALDVVVADVKMPGLSGLELLERMQADERTQDIPVVLLTGLLDARLKRRALDLGAADLLNKPIETEDLLARVRSALRLKACQDELRAANRLLEDRVQQRTEELLQSHLEIIWRLAKVAEFRDEQAGKHVIRVGGISRAIASSLGMSRRFVQDLCLAAPLHDIGKIGIPDYILLKRDRLSAPERQVMQEHCVIGERILREDAQAKAVFLEWRGACSSPPCGGAANPFLEMAATVALMHHEQWDGSGYPQGLSGPQIPVEARIVALADVFDALCSRRPYKPAYPEEQALKIIRAAAGSQFDPQVYAAFVEALPEIRAICRRYGDSRPPEPEASKQWIQPDGQDEEEMISVS